MHRTYATKKPLFFKAVFWCVIPEFRNTQKMLWIHPSMRLVESASVKKTDVGIGGGITSTPPTALTDIFSPARKTTGSSALRHVNDQSEAARVVPSPRHPAVVCYAFETS
jgi:hypothetical protein